MNKTLAMLCAMSLVSAAAALASTPAVAMTDAECSAAWTKADANGDGTLTDTESGRYFAALRLADKPVMDGKMTSAAFLEHCKAGHFNKAVTEVGAPLPGANSFTEGQAKDRALAAGYTNISALLKDADGVWRGTVTDGTKSMKVAVDYRGNVVAN